MAMAASLEFFVFMSDSKTPMVPLAANIQLVPKEFRLNLLSTAALILPDCPSPEAPSEEIAVNRARKLMAACGITEALVPQQHADSLTRHLDTLFKE
jgi:hypothetical protein